MTCSSLHEGQTVDDLGRVNQVVHIKLPDGPSGPKRQRTLVQGDDIDVVFREIQQRPQFLGPLPSGTPTDDVEIVAGADDPPHDQWTTSKNGVVAGW